MLTYLYCAAQLRLAELTDRRTDRGASMLEYVGVLVVVGVIVAAVWTALNSDGGIEERVGTPINDALDSIFSGDGGGED